jgi:hypothetical protein
MPSMEALVLHRSSELPQTQSPNIIWIQRKGAKINLISDPLFPESSFMSLKSLCKQTPSWLLNGGFYIESCPFPEPSFTCLSNSSKVLLIKNFTLPSKALGKERPTPRFPKQDPYKNRRPLPETYFAYPSGVPSKEALPAVSPLTASTEGDAPFPEPYFAYPSRSPVKKLSLHFPLWQLPHKETHCFQSPPSSIFKLPNKLAPF